MLPAYYKVCRFAAAMVCFCMYWVRKPIRNDIKTKVDAAHVTGAMLGDAFSKGGTRSFGLCVKTNTNAESSVLWRELQEKGAQRSSTLLSDRLNCGSYISYFPH
jgi:hypothetical protein